MKQTGLTSGTITNLTHELIEQRVIREFESISGNVGRRRVMLGFDTGYYRLIGLDIGRSSYEIVLTDLKGEILQSISNEIIEPDGPDKYFHEILPILMQLQEDVEKSGQHHILGMGIGVPGPIDYKKGALLSPPNFTGWRGFDLQSKISEHFSKLTLIEDDARTSALAEYSFGNGRNVENLLFITMGIGIGGGLVSNGEIVRGTNGLYGQVGHMTLKMDGKVCDCGNIGCWETVGSIPGILERWSGGNSMQTLKEAISKGDPEALKCMNDTLSYLENALINVFNLYDPEVVVLGGRLFPYLSEYLSPVLSNLQLRQYSFVKDKLRLEPSTFGSSQSAVGAAALLFRHLLDEPINCLEPRALSGDKVELQ